MGERPRRATTERPAAIRRASLEPHLLPEELSPSRIVAHAGDMVAVRDLQRIVGSQNVSSSMLDRGQRQETIDAFTFPHGFLQRLVQSPLCQEHRRQTRMRLNALRSKLDGLAKRSLRLLELTGRETADAPEPGRPPPFPLCRAGQ